MPRSSPTSPTRRIALAVAPLALVAGSMSADASGTGPMGDPMRFFEGRTESLSTIKVIARKPYRSKTIGRGEIKADGALHLVQRVEEEGREPYDRSWKIRQVGPHRFAGTMSEAKGPVSVEEVGGRYRFRFRMKGAIAIEQWLTPLPGGKSAKSKVVIRKLGLTVGHSEGVVRKL